MRVLILPILLTGALGGAELPQRLAATGLLDARGALARDVQSFTPQYPLWSDGAAKTRWVRLPKGSRISRAGDGSWRFPVGTKFWKEFQFQGRKVETRFLWKVGDTRWLAASYAWTQDQREACLVPETGRPGAAPLTAGLWHHIPSRQDCRTCHGNGASGELEPLGFNALQLSPDRDPGALRGEPLKEGDLTLPQLAAQGRFAFPVTGLLSQPPRIAAEPGTRAVLGYLASNCGACHRTDHPIPDLDLDLHLSGDAPAGRVQQVLASLLRSPGKFRLTGDTTPALRVVPGDPDHSSLAYRMASRRPASQMPPLGSALVDEEALGALRRWIAALPSHP